MNIFWYEFRSRLKTSAIWTASIMAIMILFQTAIYPVFMDSKEDVVNMLAGFPPEYLAMFGFGGDQMFSFQGFFALTYNYIALMCGIFAAYLAISVFSSEKRSKCSDFLISKPVKRGEIFTLKLASVLLLLVLSSGLMTALCCVLYSSDTDKGKLSLCFLGLFLVELVFMALGTAAAVCLRKIRSVSGIATALGFAGFIVAGLSGIVDRKALEYIAVMKYFEPNGVYSDGPDTGYVVISLIAACIITAASAFYFSKHDVRS